MKPEELDFVYLVGTRGEGEFKIGVTCSPERRLKQLRTQTAVPDLEMIHCVPVVSSLILDGIWVEDYLHHAFRYWCVGGNSEWFTLPPADVELFKTIGTIKNRDDFPQEVVNRFMEEEGESNRRRQRMEETRLKRIVACHTFDVARQAVRESCLTNVYRRAMFIRDINAIESVTRKQREKFIARCDLMREENSKKTPSLHHAHG